MIARLNLLRNNRNSKWNQNLPYKITKTWNAKSEDGHPILWNSKQNPFKTGEK